MTLESYNSQLAKINYKIQIPGTSKKELAALYAQSNELQLQIYMMQNLIFN